MNHHNILGVGQNASASEIQAAFRTAAMDVHPDHSNSPEAAEAFVRIKEARDELMKRANDIETHRANDSALQSAAAAVQATTNAAFNPVVVDDLFDGMTPEEVAHVQMLDQLVFKKAKKSFFKRTTESEEVKMHRKKLKTNERRLRGKY